MYGKDPEGFDAFDAVGTTGEFVGAVVDRNDVQQGG